MNNRSEFEQKMADLKHLHSPHESGQAIVIIAMLMVVLLGMLGAAIDGGGLFFLQRDAQNATDAAVLSASYAICTRGDPVAAGLATMSQNGFNNNGFTNTVTINYPPTSGDGIGDMHYVEVMLNAHKPAYFIQLLYRQPLQVSTRAIGNCIPPFDPSSTGGLWAGSTTCQNTMDWSGSNGKITGAIFSNNEIKFTGANTVLHGGKIEAVNDIETSNSGNVTWAPGYPPTEGAAPQLDPLDLPIGLYAPGGEIAMTIPPNLYHAIPRLETTDYSNGKWSPNKGTAEGLYFVEGDVDVGNGVTVGPKGITIVATGEIKFSGKSSDPDNIPVEYYEGIMGLTAKNVRYPGIIFYSSKVAGGNNPCGDNALYISSSHVSFHGIVYAPRSGVNVSGSNLYFNGSIIADVINYSGAYGEFRYDESLLPPRPPQIQMVE